MKKLLLVVLIMACGGSKKSETVIDSGNVGTPSGENCVRTLPKPAGTEATTERDTSCVTSDTLPEN